MHISQAGEDAAAAAAAAAVSSGPSWRVLKKDEAADFGNCVCRIMTNKRGNWQQR